MTITIRRATIKDVDIIWKNNCAMAIETENVVIPPDTAYNGVLAILKDSSKGTYYLASSGDSIVAQLMLTFEWSDWRNANCWWVQSVYVEPSHRRQGIYTQLYNHVRSEAKAEDVCSLRLYVDKDNITAQKTYEALGMFTHYLMYEDDIDV